MIKPKKYYLIDYDHNSIKIEQIYEAVSRVAIKYGAMGDSCKNYTQDRMLEFWNYDDDCPIARTLFNYIKLPEIKWHIHNKITFEHPIWNSDFLHGLVSNCKVSWNKKAFPSCEWFNNKNITDLFASSPFGGKIVESKGVNITKWWGVPALYLKYSEDSIHFMAGVMAGLKPREINGKIYASLNKSVLPYFKKWGIPIEKNPNKKPNRFYLVSPMWPALFTKYMPQNVFPNWISLKNTYNTEIYAPILWKTYIGKDFRPKGIPYLKSRRTIYYKYECEEGSMNKLDRLRVDMGLTELDNRIKEIVKEWGKIERD